MDFNFEDLVSSAIGAVSQAAEAVSDAVDYLFGTDSDDSNSSSDSSDSEYIGDNISNQVTDGAAVTYDYSDGSDSSSDGSDYSESGDDSSDSSDSEYIGDNLSCQVTDGAAAIAVVGSVNEDGESDIDDVEEFFEDKFKLLVGAFIGAAELQEQSDELTQEGYNQLAYDFVSNYEESVELQEKTNELTQEGYNQLAYDFVNNYEESVELQEKTNELTQEGYNQLYEMTQQGYNQLIDNAKKVINDPRDTIVQFGGSYSIASVNGDRAEGSVSLAIDFTNLGWDILVTTGGGKGTPSGGLSVFGGIAKSEGGISGLTGDGENVGASHGLGVDYSYSSSSNGVAGSVSLSSGDITSEAHGSITETYAVIDESKKALKAAAEQVKDFNDGYTQHMADKITAADDQYTDEQKAGDVIYDQVDDIFGNED